ncbi:SDR family oxidoreductase [Caproiciproducens sp. NJN-50]|uniref:SDR family NAD(P)-dependent oxidoreductase n=1 Tax=Acutalibacteraceae TaxID=3082771 RepID=UPI000FFE30B1|nr:MULTISPECIES: SDR family oxidoreductase [Acutalibacteraceae]QAT50732.1 SDR family oxidoreductase [Caproiciproducens sp. NJN-50]
MEQLLQGKIAVITGASRGIGKGIAMKFAQEGAVTVLVGRRLFALREVQSEIQAAGGKASCIAADVTIDSQVTDLAGAVIKEYGRIDILINNAGISKEMPLLEMPVEIFDEIMTANLRSVMLVTKAFLPAMVRQKYGNIINIGSGAALRGLPGSTAYSVSKAGVVCLTQALGDEVRPLGIRVNVICPGPVDTELFQKSAKREYILKAGGDVFRTETVANGALFLASDLSKGMNSQILTLRGFNRW